MTSRELIDAQFDRAVEIVQGLPKTGPIQTAYEEKLQMYRYALYEQTSFHIVLTMFHFPSLYKQGMIFNL